jgi:hypothetical protein
MNLDKYFFCYSTNLLEYLRFEKGQRFICTAFHDKTLKRFWLFERTENLKQALIEYKKRGKELRLLTS